LLIYFLHFYTFIFFNQRVSNYATGTYNTIRKATNLDQTKQF
jgi:hypothetical protein